MQNTTRTVACSTIPYHAIPFLLQYHDTSYSPTPRRFFATIPRHHTTLHDTILSYPYAFFVTIPHHRTRLHLKQPTSPHLVIMYHTVKSIQFLVTILHNHTTSRDFSYTIRIHCAVKLLKHESILHDYPIPLQYFSILHNLIW